MYKQIILTDIPEAELEIVLGDFESEGAIAERKLQDDGLWTIQASFGEVLGDAENVSLLQQAGEWLRRG